VWKRKPLDEEIRDDRSTRKKDHGQINKQRKPSLDALENLNMKNERHAAKAWKKRVKLT
jgi:hypothetical protein